MVEVVKCLTKVSHQEFSDEKKPLKIKGLDVIGGSGEIRTHERD